LSDAASLWDVKTAVRDDVAKSVGELLQTSAHNLSQILGKGAMSFEKAVRLLRSHSPQGTMVYAQAQSLIPSLSSYFSLLREGFHKQERRPYPLVIPIIDGFRRAVNLYFNQRGLKKTDSTEPLSFTFSVDAIQKGVDQFPWMLAMRLSNDDSTVINDLLFGDNSPLRTLVPHARNPMWLGVSVSGLVPKTDGSEWLDISVQDETSFHNSMSMLTTKSYIGLVVIMQELFYNACMHGDRRTISVDIKYRNRSCIIEIRNHCKSLRSIQGSAMHGLGTTEVFARRLEMKFKYSYESKDQDVVFCSAIDFTDGR
jgi:hypothetical protein